MRRSSIMRILASVLAVSLWLLDAGVACAEQATLESQPFAEESVLSVTEIEDMIESLEDPMDTEQMSHLFNAIARQEDNTTRGQLFQKLDARTTALLQHAAGRLAVPAEQAEAELPSETAGWPQSQEAMDPDMLRFEIETLHIGPQATVEDLRRRDEVVGKIARVSDPNQRYTLLGLLEARERSAEAHP